MTPKEIAFARKTRAAFNCLLCGYTGPLAYGPDGFRLCQSCQSASLAYLLPNCPECGALIGCVREQTKIVTYDCPRCDRSWCEA